MELPSNGFKNMLSFVKHMLDASLEDIAKVHYDKHRRAWLAIVKDEWKIFYQIDHNSFTATRIRGVYHA